jgi:hypothetical protein
MDMGMRSGPAPPGTANGPAYGPPRGFHDNAGSFSVQRSRCARDDTRVGTYRFATAYHA